MANAKGFSVSIVDSQAVLDQKRRKVLNTWAGDAPVRALDLYQVIVAHSCYNLVCLLILKAAPISRA